MVKANLISGKRYQNGSIIQSKDGWNPDDYKDYRMNSPVLGVVLVVYPSDHPSNKSARDDNKQRGYYWAADIRVLNDGLEGTNVIPNVVIPPSGPSGVDNFSQNLPKPTSCMLDGSRLSSSMSDLDADKLDGDRCLVQFIGGKYNQAVMTHWMPHPANRQDPSTGGNAEGALDQGSPTLMRRQGTTLAVSDRGSLFVDTNGANSKVVGKAAGYERASSVNGGDIQVDVKTTSKFEINFNTPVEGENEPSLLQTNPPVSEVAPEEREDDRTRLYLDKDYIEAIAGEVVKIISNNSNIELTPGPTGKLLFGNVDSTENMVLGQQWKSQMEEILDMIVSITDRLALHTHPTGTGPSGPPTAPDSNDLAASAGYIRDELIPILGNALSNYIFGSAVAPVELDTGEQEDETGEDAP